MIYTTDYYVQRDGVVTALGDYDVRTALVGFYKLLVHGFYRRLILIYDRVEAATALVYVSHYSAQYSHVSVGIDVNFYIQHVAKLDIFKQEYSLNYNYPVAFNSRKFVFS